MKVGFIFECGPKGADKKVCEHLTTTFFPDIEISHLVTMSDKKILLQQCGKVASVLLKEGCDLVLIIWDEQPRWGAIESKTYCKNDVENICRSLDSESVNNEQVRLICIKTELESWLAADERALSAFLSSPQHPFKCPRCKYPDQSGNAKKHLYQVFQDAKRPKYLDIDHAYPIAREIRSLDRLRRLQSFARFEQLLLGRASECQRYKD